MEIVGFPFDFNNLQFQKCINLIYDLFPVDSLIRTMATSVPNLTNGNVTLSNHTLLKGIYYKKLLLTKKESYPVIYSVHK